VFERRKANWVKLESHGEGWRQHAIRCGANPVGASNFNLIIPIHLRLWTKVVRRARGLQEPLAATKEEIDLMAPSMHWIGNENAP
jgi:hypothetical protein